VSALSLEGLLALEPEEGEGGADYDLTNFNEVHE